PFRLLSATGYCGYAERRRIGTYAANKSQQSPHFETKLAHLSVRNYIHMLVPTVADEGHLNEQSVACISWRTLSSIATLVVGVWLCRARQGRGRVRAGSFFPHLYSDKPRLLRAKIG
ncbi:hypothetical protein AOLI_G00058930, partial [Acnodon oligacanthus]